MFWNSFSSNRYLSENERYKTTDTNSFVNISNNTSPFVSITWQLNETLGFVIAYSRCPTNGNKYIHSCYLLYNYATNLFGILQRLIKSHRVLISFEHRRHMTHMTITSVQFSSKINVSSLSIWGNVPTLQTAAHGNFLMHWQMVLLPNLKFIISKQNKTPNIDPNILKQ